MASNRTVLIVDDHAIIAAELEVVLGQIGYDVEWVVDLDAAVQALERRTFLLVLLEFRAEGSVSRGEVEALLQASGTRYGFITTASESEVNAASPKASTLSKPYTQTDLDAFLDTLL